MELECPVCFEELQRPIYMCPAEHSICRHCIPKLQQCPICRRELPRGLLRNFDLESKITAILPCGFAFSGCPARVRALQHEEHIKFCPFRLVQCEFAQRGCVAWVTPTDMQHHKRTCPYWLVPENGNNHSSHRPSTAETTRTPCIFAPAGCTALVDSSQMQQHVDSCTFGKENPPQQNVITTESILRPLQSRRESPPPLVDTLVSVFIKFVMFALPLFVFWVASIVKTYFWTCLFLIFLLVDAHPAIELSLILACVALKFLLIGQCAPDTDLVD